MTARAACRQLLAGALFAGAACHSPIEAEPISIPSIAQAAYESALALKEEALAKPAEERGPLLQEALAQARVAVELAPDTFRLLVLVQDLELALDLRAAREHYSASPPDRAPDLTLSARALLPERSADAKALLTRAVEVDPDFAWARYGLAFVERQQGESDAAVRHAEEALERDRSLLEAVRLLCSLYEESGTRERAIEARRALVAATGAPLHERHRFAQLLLESDERAETKEALALLNGVLAELAAREARGQRLSSELAELKRDALLDQGTAFALRGDAAEAIAAWEAVLVLDANCLTALSNLGDARRRAGDAVQALAAFEQYLARAEAMTDPLPGDQVFYRYFYVPNAVLELRRKLGLPTEPPRAPPLDPDAASALQGVG